MSFVGTCPRSRSRSVVTSPWPAPEFLVQQFLCNHSSQTWSSPTLSSKRPYRGCKSLKANRSLPWQMPRRLVHGSKIIILLIMQACSRCCNCAILRRAYGTQLFKGSVMYSVCWLAYVQYEIFSSQSHHVTFLSLLCSLIHTDTFHRHG